MQKVLLTLTFLLASSVSYAQRGGGERPAPIARTLVDVLERLEDEARHIARRANRNGRTMRAQKFRRVARIADDLGYDVRRRVLRAIRNGRKRVALQRLRDLRPQVRRLQNSVDRIHVKPQSITRKARRVQRLTQRLADSLRRGGGGGGGHRFVTCTAVDRGWEEHWGGHSATARTRVQAERQAMNSCLAVHGRCRITSCR